MFVLVDGVRLTHTKCIQHVALQTRTGTNQDEARQMRDIGLSIDDLSDSLVSEIARLDQNPRHAQVDGTHRIGGFDTSHVVLRNPNDTDRHEPKSSRSEIR